MTTQNRTNCIEVEVTPEYLPNLSDTSEGRYVFAYHIVLRNVGNIACQLLTRYWLIRDGDDVFEVEGIGVVGDCPILYPGEAYQYSSGVSLTGHRGTMQGYYEWMAFDGGIFRSLIPVFELVVDDF